MRREKLAKFIPVNNDSKKALAFAKTLDTNYIKNVQRIKQKGSYIPTMEIVEKFKKEGWNLSGVNESRGKNRKIAYNYIQMHHPDFDIKSKYKEDEAVASLTIQNSCNGNKPMELNLGVYRKVCENGMIAFDRAAPGMKIKHTEINYKNLDHFVYDICTTVGVTINNFDHLKNITLSDEEMFKLATQAASLRYDSTLDFDPNNLLLVNRLEDEGKDLWKVFNRIQENLTMDISNLSQDIKLNKQLTSLVQDYV